jgi:hypothetical protein
LLEISWKLAGISISEVEVKEEGAMKEGSGEDVDKPGDMNNKDEDDEEDSSSYLMPEN